VTEVGTDAAAVEADQIKPSVRVRVVKREIDRAADRN